MACSKQAGDNPSLEGRPLPNAEEVLEAAKVALNKFEGAALLVYPVGTPKNCVEGKMSGQHVLSCEVCTTLMLAKPIARRSEDVYVEKLTIFIPFKRAVSLQQPDVAPLDQSSGVWVADFSSTGDQLPRNRIEQKSLLNSDDYGVIGLTNNGEYFINPNDNLNPNAIPIMRRIAGRELLSLFNSSKNDKNLVANKVGTCDQEAN